MDTPSAGANGIKLINEFDVLRGSASILCWISTALKSIVRRGNGTYGLKPVIRVLPAVLTGIDGFVDRALLYNNVMVSSQVSGTVIPLHVRIRRPGEFFLSHLAGGTYDVVITAEACDRGHCRCSRDERNEHGPSVTNGEHQRARRSQC